MVVELRPEKIDDIIGNDGIKQCLNISLFAAKSQSRPCDHTIFTGHYGCGKTTFARALANGQGGNFYEVNAASIESCIDLLNYFTRLKDNDVLFIDEIHRLKKKYEEFCYPVMEDNKFSINVENSDALNKINLTEEERKTLSQFYTVKIAPFTLIGATTDPGNLSGPLLSRFGAKYTLNPYSVDDIQKIIERSSKLLGYPIDADASLELAKRSKGVPRLANSRLKNVRDYCLFKKRQSISKESVVESMTMHGVDYRGYDNEDQVYLAALMDMQPAGIQSLAARTGYTSETIQKFIEPPMLRDGTIEITKSGRVTADFGDRWVETLKDINL